MKSRRALDIPRDGGFTLPEVLACVVITGLVIFPLTAAVFDAMNIVGKSGARTSVATDTDRLQAALTEDINQAENIQVPPPVTASNGSTGLLQVNPLDHAPGETPPRPFSYNTLSPPYSWPCVNVAVEKTLLTTITWDASKNYVYQGANFLLWNTGAAVEGPIWYLHKWNAMFTPMSGGKYVKVQIFRNNSTWDFTPHPPPAQWTIGAAADEPTPYLTGYCKVGDTNVVQIGATAPVNSGTTTTTIAGTPVPTHVDVTMTLSLRNAATDQPSTAVIDGTGRYGG